MNRRFRLPSKLAATWIAVLFVSAAAALAQTPPAPDPHQHGQESGSTQQQHAPQAPGAGAGPGMAAPGSGMPMTGGMMPMMEMMMRHHVMAMDSAMTPGIGMADRVEGRIAFLRAELKIADAQAKPWDELAQALRENAKKLAELRTAAGATATLPQKLDLQERWFTARTDGIRAIKTALARLYPTLSDEQKRSADQLLPMNLGLMPMAMGSMAGGPMPARPQQRRRTNP